MMSIHQHPRFLAKANPSLGKHQIFLGTSHGCIFEKLPNISCQLYHLPWLDRKFQIVGGINFDVPTVWKNILFLTQSLHGFRSSKSSLWKLSWNITRMAGGERISLCHHTTSPPTNSSVVCSNSQIKIWLQKIQVGENIMIHQWLWCPGKRKEAHMMPPYMRGNRLMDFMAWKCCKRLNLGDALRIASWPYMLHAFPLTTSFPDTLKNVGHGMMDPSYSMHSMHIDDRYAWPNGCGESGPKNSHFGWPQRPMIFSKTNGSGDRHRSFPGGICGCFLKWWYPQNIPKWSFLVGKPMVVGYHHFRKPPYTLYLVLTCSLLWLRDRWFQQPKLC